MAERSPVKVVILRREDAEALMEHVSRADYMLAVPLRELGENSEDYMVLITTIAFADAAYVVAYRLSPEELEKLRRRGMTILVAEKLDTLNL